MAGGPGPQATRLCAPDPGLNGRLMTARYYTSGTRATRTLRQWRLDRVGAMFRVGRHEKSKPCPRSAPCLSIVFRVRVGSCGTGRAGPARSPCVPTPRDAAAPRHRRGDRRRQAWALKAPTSQVVAVRGVHGNAPGRRPQSDPRQKTVKAGKSSSVHRTTT